MELNPTRRTLVAASLGGAAAIHLAMTPAHAAEWVPLAVAFALVGWVQGALAAAVLSNRGPSVRLAAVLVSVASVGAWLVSRTVGLPAGPDAWSPEAVGAVDLLCVGLELLTVAAILVPARRPLPRWLGSLGVTGIALATTALLATPSAAEHAHTAVEPAHTAAEHAHTAAEPAHTAAEHAHTAAEPAHTAAEPGHTAAEHTHTAAEPGHIHEVATLEATPAHDHAEVAVPTTVGTSPPVHDHGSSGSATPAAPATNPPHHHAACTAPVTPAQRQAADDLAAATTSQLVHWADLSVAEADGYVPITPAPAAMVHYGNRAWMRDGRTLDPTRPESLVYAFPKQGPPILLGAMFLTEGQPGPQVGGCLTQWHDHTNLCLADQGRGMVGVVDAQGHCPTGSHNQPTAQMLHVWDLPLAGGPFTEATPAQLRAGVVAKLGGA